MTLFSVTITNYLFFPLDSKPMGYPFDRLPLPNASNETPTTLDEYVIPDSNMRAVQVQTFLLSTRSM